VDGVFYTALQTHYRLVPEQVELIEAPSPPFFYELRGEPPHAY
jgi:hypothetical protein